MSQRHSAASRRGVRGVPRLSRSLSAFRFRPRGYFRPCVHAANVAAAVGAAPRPMEGKMPQCSSSVRSVHSAPSAVGWDGSQGWMGVSAV